MLPVLPVTVPVPDIPRRPTHLAPIRLAPTLLCRLRDSVCLPFPELMSQIHSLPILAPSTRIPPPESNRNGTRLTPPLSQLPPSPTPFSRDTLAIALTLPAVHPGAPSALPVGGGGM